jgi:hypothetical protein
MLYVPVYTMNNNYLLQFITVRLQHIYAFTYEDVTCVNVYVRCVCLYK